MIGNGKTGDVKKRWGGGGEGEKKKKTVEIRIFLFPFKCLCHRKGGNPRKCGKKKGNGENAAE